jgi:predicted metal-dependent peptidase
MSTATTKKTRKDKQFETYCTDKPIDKSLAEQVKEKLITARIALLLKQPFFGNISARLKLTPADEWCPTAATDGRHFYYNHAFIKALRPAEVEFLFGHEVLHVVYDHMERRGDRDPQLHNIAADYVVNQELVTAKVGELITTVPALYDRQYTGWSSEEVYDHLFKNAKKINIQDLLDQVLDDHMDGDDEGEGEGDGENNGDKKRPGRPSLSEEEKKAIRDEIREAVINAAKQCQAGQLPAGVQRLIKELTEPKMNWRELLRQRIESTVLSDYSWLVPSRKGWELDAVIPGMVVDQQIDVCVALDMSGSIGDKEARDFLSEIQGIMQQFDGYRIQVWCFDTEVYSHDTFTSDDGRSVTEYQIKGGGGTSFNVNWEWMKANNIEPKLFIMMTDMYTGDGFGDPNYCDTLFIVHGGCDVVAPHGVTVKYED